MQLMQRYFLEFAESLEQKSPGYLAQLIKSRTALQIFKATLEKIARFII